MSKQKQMTVKMIQAQASYDARMKANDEIERRIICLLKIEVRKGNVGLAQGLVAALDIVDDTLCPAPF